MNENEFEYEGITYVAEEQDEITCNGCAFKGDRHCPDYYGFPSCVANLREDGRYVVFVEKR